MMKVTELYVYPIKALRGIPLSKAAIGPQGIKYDRRFMLMTAHRSKTGTLTKMQLSTFPECALFSQEIVGNEIVVRFHRPVEEKESGGVDGNNNNTGSLPLSPLHIPLDPLPSSLEPLHIDLHGSPADGCRMGAECNAWFSACFGFDVVLTFIGEGQRPILGETLKPKRASRGTSNGDSRASPFGLGGFLPLLFSYIVTFWNAVLVLLGLRHLDVASAPLPKEEKKRTQESQETQKEVEKASNQPSEKTQQQQDDPWLTFTDCAPLLVASESSLRNVSARLSAGLDVPMYKFRPNIVVDGDSEDAWSEDFWAELTVQPRGQKHNASASIASAKVASRAQSFRLLLTSNCARCTSLNVDYGTGKRAAGEMGEVLKRLSTDRRVDPGIKYSPVFGRYAFLDVPGSSINNNEETQTVHLSVGDEVIVTRRNTERTVWDWPF